MQTTEQTETREAGSLHPAGSAATWQPIETAPKDGTHLMLWYPDYHRKVWIGHYYKTEIYEHGVLKSKHEGWHNGADTLALIGMRECLPTHWMALPMPPNVQDH